MTETWLNWSWKQVIWIRGGVAALSGTVILDTLFGWERIVFLEFTHALISMWDQLGRRSVYQLRYNI